MNALAQLLGYYYKTPTDIWKPGMAILLTHMTVHVIIFPFSSEESGSVEYKKSIEELRYKYVPVNVSVPKKS